MRTPDLIGGEARVSARAENVTDLQVGRISEFFGQHAINVIDVQVDYDIVDGTLELTGIPTRNASEKDAEQALQDAIAAARFIHPSDKLDMSA